MLWMWCSSDAGALKSHRAKHPPPLHTPDVGKDAIRFVVVHVTSCVAD